MLRRIVQFSIFGAFMICFSGCAKDMVTLEHFNLIIKDTSTKNDVRATMGDKYVDRGDHWEYERTDRAVSAFFYFDDDGTVIKKDWIDTREGTWNSSDEEPEGDKVYDSTGSSAFEENN